jgi:hypothetical protein
MLTIWDDEGTLPDWIIDLRLGNWGWNTKSYWNVWKWGSLSNIWALACSNDGIIKSKVKWNDLSVSSCVESGVSRIKFNKLLAVWKLDPLGSNSSIQLKELIISSLSLELSDLGRKVLVTIGSCGEFSVNFDSLYSSNQGGYGK